MPWNNQNGGSGGPWGGGGNDNNGGPWGQGPKGPKKGGGNQPPDLEDIIRKGQEQLKSMLPGGGRGGQSGGGMTPGFLGLIGLGLVGLYGFSCFYQIQADEVGVELLFGKPKAELAEPGPHWVWRPFETVERARIVENQINIGATNRNGSVQSSEGFMLSGDQNIVDVAFSVLWSVNEPKSFLFEVSEPAELVQQVAESAMREVVGRSTAQAIFRDNRAGIGEEVRTITQSTLDAYSAGIRINALNIEDVAPPQPVAEAFEEVQRAEQDEDRFIEEANKYSNEKLGAARGQAAQIREEAAGYKSRVVQEATGEAQRFLSVYEQYKIAPEVTRERLYLETMESVLKGANKVILEGGKEGSGVVPYLPLPQLQSTQGGASK